MHRFEERDIGLHRDYQTLEACYSALCMVSILVCEIEYYWYVELLY
jgi:hypothetical protein